MGRGVTYRYVHYVVQLLVTHVCKANHRYLVFKPFVWYTLE